MLGGVLFFEGEGLLLRRGSVGYYRITVRSATVALPRVIVYLLVLYRLTTVTSDTTLATVFSGTSVPNNIVPHELHS